MKRLTPLILILAVAVLTGCTLLNNGVGTLVLQVPESGYPPLEATITASGVAGGQYEFEVEGKTYMQSANTLTVTINVLPCVITVTWTDGGTTMTATATIGLKNDGPVIGRLVLNGIDDLWTIHPRLRYVVTFPYASDPEGGPVTLIDAAVVHTGQSASNTIFCPPYTGLTPPKPDLYRVRTGQGDLLNAFVFYSTWDAPLDESGNNYPLWKSTRDYVVGDNVEHAGEEYRCKKDTAGASSTKVPGAAGAYWKHLGPAIHGTDLPITPPSQGEMGYPGAGGATCAPWIKTFIPGGMTIITSTFEDEMGATTTQVDEIPTMPFPGC